MALNPNLPVSLEQALQDIIIRDGTTPSSLRVGGISLSAGSVNIDNSGVEAKLDTIATNQATATGVGASSAETARVELSNESKAAIQNNGTTGTAANVAASVASVQLLAANANRKAAIITNNNTATMHICYGATATTFDLPIAQGDYAVINGYTGAVNAIWEAGATGHGCRVNELT